MSTAKPTKDCPFCGEEILAVARKCKHCGESFDGHLSGRQSQLIEQTAKGFKLIQALGGIAMLCSLLIMVSAQMGSTPKISHLYFGMVVGGIGIVVYLYGRMGAWWGHG